MLLEFGSTVKFTHATVGRGKEARTMPDPCNTTLKTCWSYTFVGLWIFSGGGLRMNGGFQEFGTDLKHS